MPLKIKKKKKSNFDIDWDKPENKKLKQDGFRMYVAGRGINEICKHMGRSGHVMAALINREKWDEYVPMWQNAVDNSDLPYPWEKEHPKTLYKPRLSLDHLTVKNRLACVKAFSLWCHGKNIKQISEELDVSYHTIYHWKSVQKWDVCKARYLDENNPAPWDDLDVPTDLAEIVAVMETMKQATKYNLAKAIKGGSEAAEQLEPREALGMARHLKQLAEAAKINFQEGEDTQVQVNIAQRIESVRIPENTTFEAELVVDE
jgi:hypothetical protein